VRAGTARKRLSVPDFPHHARSRIPVNRSSHTVSEAASPGRVGSVSVPDGIATRVVSYEFFCFQWDGGFVWKFHFFALGAEEEKTAEGAGELAVGGGFVAVEEGEGAGVVGEGAEGEDGASGAVGLAFAGGGVGLLHDFVVDGGVFEGPETELAPAAPGHGFDGGGFGWSLRVEFAADFVDEFVEAGGGFAVEEETSGEEAVTDGIVGGVPFAFGRFGAAGFRAVFAGGAGFEFGGHGCA